MTNLNTTEKICSVEQAEDLRRLAAKQGRKVVFTNGCFDILHPGHIRYLEQARTLGDILIVAVNSDRSVAELKGPHRPVQTEQARCQVIAGLQAVDAVTTFDEETPLNLIERLVPDVLVKGGDWAVENIVGREVVEAHGGRVVSIRFEEGYSTTDIIDRVRLLNDS